MILKKMIPIEDSIDKSTTLQSKKINVKTTDVDNIKEFKFNKPDVKIKTNSTKELIMNQNQCFVEADDGVNSDQSSLNEEACGKIHKSYFIQILHRIKN